MTKRYDTASTPDARLLASGALDPEASSLLTKHYETLNPAELKRRIAGCQDQLVELARLPRQPPRGPTVDHGWRAFDTRGFTPRRGALGDSGAPSTRAD